MSSNQYAAFPAHAGFRYHPANSMNKQAVWSIYFLKWTSEAGFSLQERYLAADGSWLGTWEDTDGVSHSPSTDYHAMTDRWPKLKSPLGKAPCKGQRPCAALVSEASPQAGRIDFYLLLETHWIHYVQEPDKVPADPTTGKIEGLFSWRKAADKPGLLTAAANLISDPEQGSSWVALFTGLTYQVCQFLATGKPASRTLTGVPATAVGASFAGPDKAVYLVDMAQKKYRRCPLGASVNGKTTLAASAPKDLPSGL
ncbi:hypothetical protein [Streptomyces huiliensis]|uniref:hypothetical protein n=1 Tax=Streptomyces huiliensis TaxID=2876027 RepID=UPI001CBE0D61|nr:hypothetical protein [Streptomyces huiliensis]MBZ4319461.1 hypothetical protein [Streptomyces huiliensis]